MQSKRSSGVIDLRAGRSTKRAPRGQVPLFSQRPSSQPPRKPMPLRARRRRIRAFWALGVLILCAALFYGVSWASYLPQYNVSGITISGAKDMKEEVIKRSLDAVLDDGSYRILSRRNIFLYPRAQLEETITASFPLVKSARITRSSFLTTTIAVTIEEREPFARWCTADDTRCYFMDESGFVYTPVPESAGTSTPQTMPGTLYVFKGDIDSSAEPVGQWFVQAHLPGLLSLLKFVGQAGFTALGAEVDGQDIVVPLKEGFLLKASFGADANMLAKNLELVLSSDVLKGKSDSLEYVDLRFGNRVYYKLKGQSEVSAE